MKYFLSILLLLLALCCLSSQGAAILDAKTISGFTQGTTYTIKYYSEQEVLKEEVDSVLNIIDKSLSIYRDDSIISKFNNVKTSRIKMDNHMFQVVRESFRTYNRTNGYFDITIKPLIDLWGFGPKGFTSPPGSEEISSALSLVGMKNTLKLKGKYLIKKKEGVTLDVNGIAQGYTVDVLSKYFLSKNIRNFMIEVGGEIVTRGTKPDGEFIIMIQRPNSIDASQNTPSYKIRLKNKAITTSGSYEKKVNINGKIISHHISPKDGYPIESMTLSATVIANTAMEADALDNYLMYLSPQKAIEFAEKNKGIEIYVIYLEDNVLKEIHSSGFVNYMVNN